MIRVETTRIIAGEIEFEMTHESCRRLFLAGALHYCRDCACFHPACDEEDQVEGFIYALKCLAVRTNVKDGPGAMTHGHPAEGVGAPHKLADEFDLDMTLLSGTYTRLWQKK